MNKQDEGIKLLRDIRHITHQIETIQDSIDEVRSMLTSTTVKPKEVNVQTSGAQDPMADKIIKMLQYEEELQKYQADLCIKKSTVIKILKEMPIKDQEILTVRYIQDRSIEKTAEYLEMSYYGAWKRLNRAEEKFVELFAKVDRS